MSAKPNADESPNKESIIGWLMLITFSIYTFIFFVHKRRSDNNSFKINTSFFNMFFKLFMLLLIISVPLFILFFWRSNSDNILNSIQNIMSILIVIVILSIIAKIFSIRQSNAAQGVPPPPQGATNNSKTNIFTILIDIIFFIPCLLIIIVDEIHNDIKLTPSSIYLLFFILIILITLLFVVPLVFNYIAKHNKNDVLAGEGPFYLNEKKTLGKYQNLDKNVTNNIAIPSFNNNFNTENKHLENKMTNILSFFNTNSLNNRYNEDNSIQDTSNEDTSNEDTVRNEYYNIKDNIADNTKGYDFKLFENDLNGQYNIGAKYYHSSKINKKFPYTYTYTYSISFYIYINPQPTNTSIAYTKDTELFNYGFKPVIYYNGKSRKIIIKSRTINNKADQLDTIYEMTNVKHQKWLYFVINYENNIIDVFIDGKLVGSKNNVTPYFIGDNVTIGEDDGIHGSIKEIFYFDKIKTPDSIQFLSSLARNNNGI
jgi:hypothetical protein